MIKLLGNTLHQWDMDRQINILDDDIVNVSFSNNHHCHPTVVEVVDSAVIIPNKLLQHCQDIHVYGLNSEGNIIYECQLEVNSEVKPSDYPLDVEDDGDISWEDIGSTKTERINDYISISNQGNNQYWCVYDNENGLEVGKNYLVIINDEPHELLCELVGGKPALVNGSIDIKYNEAYGRYVINYYPGENLGSNLTVNFEVHEVTNTVIPEKFIPDNRLVVVFSNEGDNIVCNKTYEEVMLAINKLKPVTAIYDKGMVYLLTPQIHGPGTSIMFTSVLHGSTDVLYVTLILKATDEVELRVSQVAVTEAELI